MRIIKSVPRKNRSLLTEPRLRCLSPNIEQYSLGRMLHHDNREGCIRDEGRAMGRAGGRRGRDFEHALCLLR